MSEHPFRWTELSDGRWLVSCVRCDWSKKGWSQKRLGYAANGHGGFAHPDWTPAKEANDG